jgi:hypothetical protein
MDLNHWKLPAAAAFVVTAIPSKTRGPRRAEGMRAMRVVLANN